GATAKPVALPPPIPSRRMFQAPDVYGRGFTLAATYSETGIPPSMSNAGDSGDPYINSQIPYLYNATTLTTTASQQPNVSGYSLNEGFSNIGWSGGTEYIAGGAAYAPIPAPGALPPTTVLTPPGPPAAAGNDAFQYFPTAAGSFYLGSRAGGNTDDR